MLIKTMNIWKMLNKKAELYHIHYDDNYICMCICGDIYIYAYTHLHRKKLRNSSKLFCLNSVINNFFFFIFFFIFLLF